MLKHHFAIYAVMLLCLLALPQLAVSQLTSAVRYTDCINSDNDIRCQNKMVVDVRVRYGEPLIVEAAYLSSLEQRTGGEDQLLETPIQIVIAKTLPKDVFPLTFRHTVRALSSFQAARNGTVSSPYGEYRAYAVGMPRRDYEVNIEVRQGLTLLNQFTLQASHPIHLDRTQAHHILARLQDENTPPVKDGALAGSVLFVPVRQDGTLMPVYEGLLLPQAEAADILDARQLNHLRDADLLRIAENPNKEADYLVKHKLAFKNSIAAMGNSLMLVQEINDRSYSTVHLTIDAAKIGEIRNEAMGWITHASVEPFEAMSQNGKFKVTIGNVGVVPASYLVTIHSCSTAIPPMVTGPYYIAAGTQKTLEVAMPTNFNNASNGSCRVSLTASSGKLLDEVQVLWSTTGSDVSRVQF